MQSASRQDMRDRKVLAKVLPLETPFTVAIDIVSLCNFKCVFCFHSIDRDTKRELNFKPGVMDYELFKKTIDQIADFPDKLKKLALYMRGEPLLHPKLPDMISYAKKRDVSESIQITTNGYLLRPKINLKLIDAGLDELVISVESLSDEGYKKITGVSIDYDIFIDNINHFYNNKCNCKLYIKILDIGLEDDIIKFHELFDHICDKAFIEHVIPQYKQVSYIDTEYCFTTDVRGHDLNRVDVCAQPFLSLYVLHDGNVCACCVDFNGNIVFGNVKRNSLIKMWQSKALRDFRILHLKRKRYSHFECGKCNYPYYNTLPADILDYNADEILSFFSKE